MLPGSTERDQWYEMDKATFNMYILALHTLHVKNIVKNIYQKQVPIFSSSRTSSPCIYIYFANALNGLADLPKQTHTSSSV